MKSFSMFASVVALASAGLDEVLDDCVLYGSMGKLDVTCTIPGSAQIIPGCCDAIQGAVNSMGQLTADQQEYAAGQCYSFTTYMTGQMPKGIPPHDPAERTQQMINALPDGLSCTETITGGGEVGCELHAAEGKLGVTCEIPQETTISSECCSAIQDGIDKAQTSLENGTDPAPGDASEAMQKCQSVQHYYQQLMPQPHSGPVNPVQVINSLPGGLSCMERTMTPKVSAGGMLSLYANSNILSAINLAAGIVSNDQVRASNGFAVVLGTAGFISILAGVAFSRLSKKQHGNQQPLLIDSEVA